MCKVTNAVSKLTLAERATLGLIGQEPVETQVQERHGNKLIGMGLAIPFNGRLVYTPLGRKAAEMAEETSAQATNWWHQRRY